MGLWDSVTGFFSDLGDFFSGKDFFEAAGYAWNDMMKLAADVLTKNPSSGTYKDVWENISTIYTTLNVVAVSLLCIFFLYGFCRDSCDLHADLTFERTIKMFIRLIITSRLYKYPFEDQLLIYAQRPDATACASLEMWNERMFCWVNRGAKGIALIDGESERPKLRYVPHTFHPH